MTDFRASVVVLAAALSVTSCGNQAVPPVQIAEIAIPNNPSKFVFDISYVDSGRYYIADRTNKALSVFNTSDFSTVAVVPGFFGIATDLSPDESGPDGVLGVPGSNLIYVGDVGSVKIVDMNATPPAIVKKISIAPPYAKKPSIFRADEGCYDPDDKLMMFAHPGDTIDGKTTGAPAPFATWISTDTQSVVAQFAFPNNATGLEQCVYDPNTKSFYVNNDGTDTNPQGEVDVITAASVVAKTPSVATVYPLPNCGQPTGLVLGPGQDMFVACTQDAGGKLSSPIIDRTTGKTIADVPIGGADQMVYDPATNRYLAPLRYWTYNGISAGRAAVAGVTTPVFAAIDATTHAVIGMAAAGPNTHSVAIDSAQHKAFVPHNSGGSTYTSPGISVYSTN